MIISDEQIKQIALSIVFDVHQYIIEHQEEYEQFITEEESNDCVQNHLKEKGKEKFKNETKK